MTKRKKINLKDENLDIRYSNIVSTIIQLVKPKNLAVIGGRGTSKTTDIQATRTMDISHEMPGCYIALSSDTYMNALKNVVPALLEGFQRHGWIEDIHYVVGKRPPTHFKKPYKKPELWKHTITIHTGTHIKLISMDRPSTGAGDSYQHIIGDETKFQSEKKIGKLTPAVRGEAIRFSKSPYYRGRTWTTDMPNKNHNEHDWILRLKKNMNKEQIKLIFQVALVLNELRIELYHAEKAKDEKKIININRNIERWTKRYDKVRKDSTLYFQVSSYVNADILTPGFFDDLLKEMDFTDVKTSILSIEPKLEKGQKFYPNLTTANFYSDSYNYNYYDQFELTNEGVSESCLGLKYLKLDEPIEAGLDTGNMCSMAIGQPFGSEYRIIKNLYTIPPDFLPELAKQFRNFFKEHQRKELILFHDRAANAYEAVREDHASKFKKAIEYDEDRNPTGWTCTLMNRGQSTITQQKEYELLLAMCIGSHSLPKLLIDKNEAPEAKSSMELTKIIVREDKNGKKTIHKQKSSEKLAFHLLPKNSTNMSDAVKYLLCRPEFFAKLNGESSYVSSDPKIY
ncbi:hypothetical protein [Aureivirga marina]|uniref:hypothetical protein n=1 Tax=Aureivirga marina TaxID=1182451 RepID=UPI0018CB85A7|nr:hypothetical protein [Aureivirga marina]